jgi:hypothetical protein
MTTDRTAIRRRLAIRGWSHRPPRGARKAGHDSIVAPLTATVAATLAVGVGLVLARSERQRRRARQRQLERRLGLQRGEPLGAGLRRMALSQAELAIEMLSDGASGDNKVGGNDGTGGISNISNVGDIGDIGARTSASGARPADETAVHETRKALKRLRALVRLLEHELGANAYARESATLREVAAHLSAARDAAVMLSTLDALIKRHPRKLASSASVRKLRQRLRTEHAQLQQRTLANPASRAHVLGELHAFRWRVATWTLTSKPGIELIDNDLTHLYRQGRKRYQRAALDRGKRITTMHEWRKRVKDLRYAAEMLDRSSSKPSRSGKHSATGKHSAPGKAARSKSARHLREIAGRADQLSELLGEEHDLAVFAQHLRAAGRSHGNWHTGRRTRRTLLKLIAKRRRKLQVRALRQGSRLYSMKPKRFTRAIRRLS